MLTGIRITTINGDDYTLYGKTTFKNETYYCNGYSYPSEIVKEVIYSNSQQGRLTFKYPQGTTNYLKYNNDGIRDYKYQQGIDRLAEYENTELSPEEVENMKTENTNLKANWDILCNKFGEIIANDKDCESGCYSEALRIINEVKQYSGEYDELKHRADVAKEFAEKLKEKIEFREQELITSCKQIEETDMLECDLFRTAREYGLYNIIDQLAKEHGVEVFSD